MSLRALYFNKILFSLLLSGFVTLGSPITWAQAPRCSSVFSLAPEKPVVSQCAGTCYFESALGSIESKYSQYSQRQVGLSRPHLFAELIIFRLKTLTSPQSNQIMLTTKEGLMDFVSAGSVNMMKSFFNQSSLYVTKNKNSSLISRENEILQIMYKTAGTEVHKILNGSTNPDANQKQKLKEALPEIEKALNEILNKAKLKTEHPSNQHLFSFENIRVIFEANSPKPLLSKLTENQIIDHISKGEELMLSYKHSLDLEVQDRLEISPGMENYNLTKAISEGRAGGHFANIVDVIKDNDGRVSYLVIKNSWGPKRENSDHGYQYMSVEYFQKYGEAVFFPLIFKK